MKIKSPIIISSILFVAASVLLIINLMVTFEKPAQAQAGCALLPWAGAYMTNSLNASGGVCRHPNPATGNCTCQAGYTPSLLWEWNAPNSVGNFYGGSPETIWQCYS